MKLIRVINLPCIFHLTQFSMRGPSTSKLIAALLERRLHRDA